MRAILLSPFRSPSRVDDHHPPMNPSDHRMNHDGGDRSAAHSAGPYPSHLNPGNVPIPASPPICHFRHHSVFQTIRGPNSTCSSLAAEEVSYVAPAVSAGVAFAIPPCCVFFAHMAAALGSGKTSFLRLLLDTSVVSPRTTKDQLASVAKFVHGCSGHTSYIRAASIDINLDLDGSGQQQTLSLTLIDTPSLDLRDEVPAERLLSETLRHIDSRFAEGIEDVRRLSIPPSTLKAISLHRNGKQRRATVTCTCESWLLISTPTAHAPSPLFWDFLL